VLLRHVPPKDTRIGVAATRIAFLNHPMPATSEILDVFIFSDGGSPTWIIDHP
jgi:hypothetical protein